MRSQTVSDVKDIYKQGLEPIADTGLAKPVGPRVLVKAIYAQDAFSSILANEAVMDIKDAVAFEIVSIGPDVPGDLEPGMHCDHRSAAFDALDWSSKEKRWATVHYEDITVVWDPKAVAEAMTES